MKISKTYQDSWQHPNYSAKNLNIHGRRTKRLHYQLKEKLRHSHKNSWIHKKSQLNQQPNMVLDFGQDSYQTTQDYQKQDYQMSCKLPD
mgnify:CR=1 FL=1